MTFCLRKRYSVSWTRMGPLWLFVLCILTYQIAAADVKPITALLSQNSVTFSSGKGERAKRERLWKSPHEKEETRWGEKNDHSTSRLFRVGWFSRALAFRSLYHPWGKMGTTRGLWSYIHLGYAHPHGYRVASLADGKSYPITPIRYVTLSLKRSARGSIAP